MPPSFNVEQFLETSYEQANDTRLPLIPEIECNAQVDKLKLRTGTSKESQEPYTMLDIFWELLDPNIADQLEMKKVIAIQSVFLDINEAGSLDMGKGKNVGLGRVREGLGMNEPGKRFALRQLVGAIGKIKVVQDMINDGPRKGEMKNLVANVGRV